MPGSGTRAWQLIGSLAVAVAIAVIAVVVVTAHFGPTSVAELDAREDRIDARADAREDALKAREDRLEELREAQ